MDDQDFFSMLYQEWSKTTGAGDSYWMQEDAPETWETQYDEQYQGYALYAVGRDESKTLIGFVTAEQDAAWITTVHGCFSDLTRRLMQAIDEAERFDCEKDQAMHELAVVSEENNELIGRLRKYES